MITLTNQILASTLSFVAIMVALILAVAASSSRNSRGVNAYFEFDHDLLWGEIEKTTLPNGKIRHKSQRFENAKIPDAIRASIEAENPLEYDAETMHFSGHYDITMNPEYKFFKVEEHTDSKRMVCHESADINMRLSLFSISGELKLALEDNEDHPVILTAAASKHQCHGQPIFRKIVSVHHVSGSDEVLLVTSKAKYEEIWSDADIEIHVQHPTLTHVDSHKAPTVFDKDANDHGIDWNAAPTTKGASLVRRAANLMYQREQVDNDVNGLWSKKTGSAFYPAYQQQNEATPAAVVKHETAERHAHAQWGCCKCCKKIVNAVKKSPVVKTVTKTVTTTAKKAVTAVKGVAAATGKGIVAAANAVANLLSISADIDKKVSHTFSSCDLPKTAKLCDKPMIGLLFTFEMKFTTTLHFKFKISNNDLKLFHTSLTGALSVGAGARTKNYQDGSGQVKIITISGPRMTFLIVVVPLWIDTTFPILGGVSVTYGTKDKPFAAGYDLTASATIGVEWTSANGFTMLTSKSFTHGYNLDYPTTGPAQINVAPYIGVQARFALYSMVVGYPQIQFGLDNTITVNAFSYCKLRLYSKFFIKLSAGLDFELVIKTITIFAKSYGPYDLYKWTKPVYNFCMRTLPTLPPINAPQQQQQQVLALPSVSMMSARDAMVLGDATTPPPTTSLEPEDSGKVWNTNFTCGNVDYEFTVTGFFGGTEGNFTFFFVELSRNITNSDGSYTLASQSFLAYMDRAVTLNLDFIAVIVTPTEEIADELNMTYTELNDLFSANSGNPNISSLPLTYINVTFSPTDLDDATFFNPNLCSGKKIATNEPGASESQNVKPEGTFASRLIAKLAPQVAESFMDLITGTLVTVLVIAIIELVIIIFLPKIIGQKFFPKRKEDPRYREYVYGVIALCVGALCYVCFIVGGAMQWATIAGARMDPNYVPPPPGAPQGALLTASGVESSIYEFVGSSLEIFSCQQYFPCTPNCRDLCKTRTAKWIGVVWPYCSSNAIMTDEGGCTMFAWDAVIDAVFSFIFLVVGCALPLLKFSNIYRRMPLSNACLLLSGMCLALLEKRITSFMTEVRMELFDPADGMIIPYELELSGTSMKLVDVSVTAFWVLCAVQGLITIHELLDYYKQTKDGKIIHLEEDFMDEVEHQQMRDLERKNRDVSMVKSNNNKNERASVTHFENELSSSQQQQGDHKKAFPEAPSLDI